MSETFLILRGLERNIINMYIGLNVKCFNLDFFYRFSKNAQISNFMKILPVGAELFDAEHGKLIVAFGNFANASKNCSLYPDAVLLQSITLLKSFRFTNTA